MELNADRFPGYVRKGIFYPEHNYACDKMGDRHYLITLYHEDFGVIKENEGELLIFYYEITFLNLKRVCQNRHILTSIKYPKAFNYSSHHCTITLSRFPSEYPSIITLTIAAPLPMGVPVACSMIPEHSRPAPRLPLSQ